MFKVKKVLLAAALAACLLSFLNLDLFAISPANCEPECWKAKAKHPELDVQACIEGCQDGGY